jgi:hypothetical protein
MDKYTCAAEITTSGTVTPANVAHYSCTVQLAADGSVCPDMLALDRPPTGGYNCTGVEIADAATQLTDKITQGGVTVTVSEHIDAATSCAAVIALDGKPMSQSVSLSGLVSYALSNKAGVAIPITIQFAARGCNAPMSCTLDPRAFSEPTQTACAAAWPAATVVTIPSVGAAMLDPTLTADLRDMLFEAGNMIYETTRSNNLWSTPLPLTLTTDGALHAPELSGDGTTLVFVGTLAVTSGLFIATRPNVGAAFSMGTLIANPGDATLVFSAATIAPDDSAGMHHLIAAGINGASTSKLYDLEVDLTMHTVTQETLIPIAVPNADHPHLTADGLQLYFDGQVNGKTTLWVASRRTINESFAEAVNISELDTTAPTSFTNGAWVGNQGRTMYFSHGDTVGVSQIYTTTRVSF